MIKGNLKLDVVEHIILRNMWEYFVLADEAGDEPDSDIKYALVMGFNDEIGTVSMSEIKPHIISRTTDMNDLLPASGYHWEEDQTASGKTSGVDALRPVSVHQHRLTTMSESRATEATATRLLGMASTACLLAEFFRPSKFGENKMIEKSTSEYGQAVSVCKCPAGRYGTNTYTLRDGKGNHVGTLCLTASGGVTLVSSAGYELADGEILVKHAD